MEKKGIETIRK